MKPVLLAIGAAFIIMLAPTVLTGVNEFRTTDREDVYSVDTAAASTDVVLTQDLYSDATYNVTSVSSNVTEDAPLASSYEAATNTLTITGLSGDAVHRLTVDYKINALTEFPGAASGASTVPLFLILGVIGIIAGAVYSATRHGE